jgi:hypothetical protein
MRSSSIAGALRAALAWLRWEADTWLRLLWWWPAWATLGAVLLALTLAYQVPHTYSVDIGSAQDQLYVRNFHGRSEEETPSYRWSGVYSYVAFPGLGGSRPFTASLTLDPERTAPVTIIVNGETLFEGVLQPGWQTLTLAVNEQHPGALASRDTVLEIRAPDYRTPDAPGQPKGVKLDSAVVEQAAVGGFITPAYSALALLTGGVLLFYLFVGRALAGFASLKRARLWALLAALSLGLTLAVLLAQSHVAVAAAASHLLVTLVSMILLFIAGNALAGRLVGRTYPVAAQGLALCLALAFGVRYGGMALPQSVIIDMPWHMKWLRTLLAGDWQSLYFPGGLSAVPREWGLELLIPKSPLFYFAFAPLNIIPSDLETSAKWLTCLLDATLVLAVFWLVLRVGGGRGAAVLAAALYAFMPLAFRAFAYGILPTIFAQWLTVGTLRESDVMAGGHAAFGTGIGGVPHGGCLSDDGRPGFDGALVAHGAASEGGVANTVGLIGGLAAGRVGVLRSLHFASDNIGAGVDCTEGGRLNRPVARWVRGFARVDGGLRRYAPACAARLSRINFALCQATPWGDGAKERRRKSGVLAAPGVGQHRARIHSGQLPGGYDRQAPFLYDAACRCGRRRGAVGVRQAGQMGNRADGAVVRRCRLAGAYFLD